MYFLEPHSCNLFLQTRIGTLSVVLSGRRFFCLAGFGVLRRTFGPSGVAPGGAALCTSAGLHVDPGHHFNIQWIYLCAYINVCICMYIIKIVNNNNSTSTVIIK